MKSMTGYGRGECAQDGFKVTVELSSVNRKQAEVSVTLPPKTEMLEAQIRAGVLEDGSVELLRSVGLGARLDKYRRSHDGTVIAWQDHAPFLIDTMKYTGRKMTAYGQTAITEDLYRIRESQAGNIVDDARHVVLTGIDGDEPVIAFEKDGKARTVACDFIAGCDGFHGVCRPTIPSGVLTFFDRSYPFAWLGILVQAPPSSDELVYAHSERGFALLSMRSTEIGRLYMQVPPDADLKDYPDDRVWRELHARFAIDGDWKLTEGPVLQKNLAPMRSFVAEPMQYGRLYLAGDAAHIVPATGAKGLNLAAADVRLLSQAFADYYSSGGTHLLEQYSRKCLRRVWKAQRFSWWMTTMLHRFGTDNAFDQQRQVAELDYLTGSHAAMTSLAENYVGLPWD